MRSNRMILWIFIGFLVWGILFAVLGKSEQHLWKIPLGWGSGLIIGAIVIGGLFFRGIRDPWDDTNSWFVKGPIMAMALMIAMGVIFQEPDIWHNKATAGGGYEVQKEQQSSGNTYVRLGGGSSGSQAESIEVGGGSSSNSGDGDSFSDLFDDLDGEAAVALAVIILILLLIIGSALVHNFWVISCAVMLGISIVAYIRQKNYER